MKHVHAKLASLVGLKNSSVAKTIVEDDVLKLNNATKVANASATGIIAASVSHSSWWMAKIDSFLTKAVGMASKGPKAQAHLHCMGDLALQPESVDILLTIALEVPDLAA
eukprot:3804149-Amphidinium_carterae.6